MTPSQFCGEFIKIKLIFVMIHNVFQTFIINNFNYLFLKLSLIFVFGNENVHL